MSIRLAKLGDLNEIVKIYNQAVIRGNSTADLDIFSVESKLSWFEFHHNNETKYPIFVYEVDKKCVGWISISSYREGRKALELTVEISYYIHNDYQQQGIGFKLVEHAINYAKKVGYKNLLAIVLSTNTPSIKLLNNLEFSQWANLPNVAIINGEEVSHLYFGMKL